MNRPHFLLLGAALAGCVRHEPAAHPAAVAAPVRTEAPQQYPQKYDVRWSRTLELDALERAGAQLSREDPQGFGELERDGDVVRPTTCLQWSALHGQGFEAVNTLEEQADHGAKLRCRTLELLQQARAAQVSHVRSLPWDRSLLPLLPSIVATAVSRDEESAVAAAMEAGKSLADYDPKAHLGTTQEPETIEVLEGEGDMMVIVHAEAWGDFNADGTDDLVVSVINGATQGSFRSARLMTLTRTSDAEPLRLVAVQ